MKQTNDDDVLMQIEGINVKEFSKEEYEFYFNNTEFFRRILHKGGKEATTKLIQEFKDKINEFEFTNIVRMNSNLGANITQDRIKEELLKWLSEKEKEIKE
ncbi:MAG: hypothetical protein AABY22_09800 [Nanoarchaeota archaeon]